MEDDSNGGLRRELFQLESSLLEDDVRCSPERLALLLEDGFTEFGASGRIYKWEYPDPFGPATARIRIEQDSCRLIEVSADAALLLYTAISTTPEGTTLSRRSSLWPRREGTWRMVFHQGTRAHSPTQEAD